MLCPLAITFTIDGKPVQSATRLRRSGPYVLIIDTVMPGRGLAVELHSTFVGHSAVPTQMTHLLLGPVGHAPHCSARADELRLVDPVGAPDSCVYAHCQELTALLADRGFSVAVEQLPERPVPLSR